MGVDPTAKNGHSVFDNVAVFAVIAFAAAGAMLIVFAGLVRWRRRE
jgi:LPXTG-motif cell wall-anchored protein